MAMVSSDLDYPPRLYAEGKSNLENKTINHNCRFGDFADIREAALGHDVWDKMKELPVGIIAKLSDSKCVWSGKTVHYLLCRQLRVKKKEIWCLPGGQPIRFSLHEFGEITGLNTDPLPTERYEADYKPFWDEMKVPYGEGPKLDELRAGLEVCRTWSFEKRKWLGLLFLQATGIYGVHHNSRIPFESAKRVFDDEAMRTYPWGRSAFEFLVDSIKMLRPQGGSYTLNGMVHVLLAWAYESVACFGERFGNIVNKDEVPLLRWGGNRTRSSMESLISEEIKAYGEVRVRKMVMKDAPEELFPEWPDEEEDPQLDRLILHIHQGAFVKGFWDVKTNEKKKIVKAVVAVESDHPRKKQKVKKDKNQEFVEEDMGRDASVKTLMGMVERLHSRLDNIDGRFDTFETTIRGAVEGMEKGIGDRVEARMDEKYGTRMTDVEIRVGSVEDDVKQMKDYLKAMGVGLADQNDCDDQSGFHILFHPRKRRETISVNSPPVRPI